jgi:hypothetical protein
MAKNMHVFLFPIYFDAKITIKTLKSVKRAPFIKFQRTSLLPQKSGLYI